MLDGDEVVGEEALLMDQGERIRDVRQGPDGALWVLTDDTGEVLRDRARVNERLPRVAKVWEL